MFQLFFPSFNQFNPNSCIETNIDFQSEITVQKWADQKANFSWVQQLDLTLKQLGCIKKPAGSIKVSLYIFMIRCLSVSKFNHSVQRVEQLQFTRNYSFPQSLVVISSLHTDILTAIVTLKFLIYTGNNIILIQNYFTINSLQSKSIIQQQ